MTEVVYPLGEQSFSEIRNAGKVYVDKTMFIPLLKNKFYFLSRPRRFGKSLLLSTLECYFSGKKDLFDGLSIMHSEEEWKEYPIIRIDLNGMNYTESEDSLKSKLTSQLQYTEKNTELRPMIPTSPCVLKISLSNSMSWRGAKSWF